ncbi:unnamed protein product [Ceratitis capitata]|uniref:(Mediterranean fruit fly) hypothetical protein n=1 Tax=Ceratitis capitata TaxID=7213 RepID=A0A811UN42_CERCA|nr:unnamed protein product [Ceratitis capitata]
MAIRGHTVIVLGREVPQLSSHCAVRSCPAPNGRFADDDQCDAYLECKEGVGEEKLCPDGLLFNQRTKNTGDCTYLPFTTCKERTRLQPANGTAECPRQFGFYNSGDPKNCGVYKNCAHGEVTLTKCPEGLAFNVESYQCDWPDLVAECDAEGFLGFTCPPPETVDGAEKEVDTSPEGELRYFRHPNTCKKYFVCVNGHPRLYNCGKYLAFNVETKLCDFYTHVPECYALLKEKKAAAAASRQA